QAGGRADGGGGEPQAGWMDRWFGRGACDSPPPPPPLRRAVPLPRSAREVVRKEAPLWSVAASSLTRQERRRVSALGHFTRVSVRVWSRAGWPAAAWEVSTRVSPVSFMSASDGPLVTATTFLATTAVRMSLPPLTS